MTIIDENYVQEILEEIPAGITREQFRKYCQPDINGGYRAEVDEAERRYFKSAARG
jgi:hypothetical protein